MNLTRQSSYGPKTPSRRTSYDACYCDVWLFSKEAMPHVMAGELLEVIMHSPNSKVFAASET